MQKGSNHTSDEIFTAKWQLGMKATGPIWAVSVQYRGDRAMAQNVWQQRFSAESVRVVLPPTPLPIGP